MKKGIIGLFHLCMISGVVLVGFGSMAFGQPYTGWLHSRDYIMNPAGAGIAGNVVNFPALIRLTNADSAVFSGSQTGGADLRFARGSNLSVNYPYQIERWDATNKLAEIWVLVDTVFAASSSQSVRMYYGNSGASAGSNGPAVFNSANGFAAVWHLQDTTDALGNLPLTGASKPASCAGVIGLADTFNGTNQYLFTADSTSTNATALNFPNGGPFTLSAWVYVPAGSNYAERAILDKGNNNWELKQMGGSAGQFGGLQFVQTGNGTYYWSQASSAASLGAWHYAVFVRTNAGTSPTYAETVYVDGVVNSTSVGAGTNGTQTLALGHSVAIGNRPEKGNWWWNGKIDEPEVSNVARSADWINLCFANQIPGQSFVTCPVPAAPALSSPSNGASGLPLSLSLSWNSVSADSYRLQVSSASDFSSTILDQVGISATVFPLNGLSNSATYFWRVDGRNSVGEGLWAQAWSFITEGTVAAPALFSPTNNAITQPLSPTLSWGTVAGAATYGVQIAVISTFGTTVFSQAALTAPTATVAPNLAYETVYFWKANASSAGGSSLWSSVWTFTTLYQTPSAPALSSPTNGVTGTATSLTLSWGTSSGSQTYAVQVSTNSSFTTTVFGSSGLTATTAALGNLSWNTTYYWSVNGSNPGATGTWSAVWSFKTMATSVRKIVDLSRASFSVHNGVLEYSMPGPAEVEIAVKDIMGRTELTIRNKQQAGHFSVNLKRYNLVPGRHLIRFKSGSFERNAVFITVR